MTDDTTDNTHGGMSRRSSGASTTSILCIEVPVAQRRRLSNISFEKHDSFVLAELSALIDNDEYDEQPPSRTPADGENSGDKDNLLDSELQGSFHQSFGRMDRRTSEISVDINEIAGEFEDDRNEMSGVSGFSDSSVSVLSKIQDGIISKEIRAGKIIDKTDLGGSSSSLGRRGSYGSRRGSYGSAVRRGSSSSGRRVSFRGQQTTLQEDVQAAMEELRADGLDEDDDEEEEDACGGGAAPVSTTEVLVTVPPPPGARPRRSSLKRPKNHHRVPRGPSPMA